MTVDRTSPSFHSSSIDQRLAQIFNETFEVRLNTIVRGGAHEPLYTPGSNSHLAIINYCYDYEASLLHEVAHWCIAGRERRSMVDYGYWYEPDGRDEVQQAKFVEVEARPQAVEWYLSAAANLSFQVSLDNLALDYDSSPFKDEVYSQMLKMLSGQFPPRAREFANALISKFDGTLLSNPMQVSRTMLDNFKGS